MSDEITEVIASEDTAVSTVRDSLEKAYDSVEEKTDLDQSTKTEAVQDEISSDATPLDPVEPPRFWSADKKEHFKSLPREVQEYIVEKENERDSYTNRTVEQERKKYRAESEIKEALEPIREQLQLKGINEGQYVRQLLAADSFLQTNPKEAVRWFAESNGVDLQELLYEAQMRPQLPPEIQTMYQRLQELESIEAQRQAQYEHLNGVQSTHSEIEKFALETNDKGELLRPHFKEVQDQLVDIVARLREEDPSASPKTILRLAYDEAVSPIKEKLKLQTEKARLEKARRAASSVYGSPGSGEGKVQPKNTREAMEAYLEGKL